MTGADSPAEPPGPFPTTPLEFTDREGREIHLRRVGEGPPGPDAARAALVRMYAEFDPADRAQGIPPTTEAAVEDWVDRILGGDGLNVLAWHDDRVAGHATLAPDHESSYELAIFVHQDYQRAGIGSRLIRALLGEGAAEGIDRIWLTVERWNRPAIDLYESVGFETADLERFELEMTLDLGEATQPG